MVETNITVLSKGDVSASLTLSSQSFLGSCCASSSNFRENLKNKGFFDQLTWHIARESPQTNRELLISAQTALGTWGTAPTCENPKSTWAVPPAPHPAAPMGPCHQHPQFARQGGGWWAHQAEGFPAQQREIAYDHIKKNFKRSKTKHLVAETNTVMLSKDVSSRWGLENKKQVWIDLQRNFFPSTLLYNW